MTEPTQMAPGLLAHDRRSEERYAADGYVHLRLESPQQMIVRGRLLDISEHGMRVEHMYTSLASGMVLQVEVDGVLRTARVMWNRITSEGVDSGFYLI